MNTPRSIIVTTGEPAGIGPDITLMAAQREWDAHLVAVGDIDLLVARAATLGLPVELIAWDPGQAAHRHRPGLLPVLHAPLAAAAVPGQLNPANARYVLNTLDIAIKHCRSGPFHAMVTAPVQKSVINDAGVPFSGHTEYLADQTGTDKVVMMLATEHLRVALVTTHLPLSAVPAAVTRDNLVRTIEILHSALRTRFGIAAPTIAVLGLNPHAGEGGHLGREEIDTIAPTLETLRGRGWKLPGPLPADTAFNPQWLSTADAFLAMYHDQGLPVLKYAGFGEAVNITLGLPIVRTSVDHGTALTLAGTGGASPNSLVTAIDLAVAMSAGVAATRLARPAEK
ncbi:MAG: 4-hydroxythreonine-4-phosphate dehydrogenase PdxA [Parahaliea sp.]